MNARLGALRNMGQWIVPIRQLMFGKQNERIEFVMDSYYKLSPEARTGVIAGGIFVSGILLIFIVSMYVFSLGMLQDRLEGAFEATNQLRDAKTIYTSTKKKFEALEERLNTANQNLSIISVLETKAKDLGLQTRGFPPQVPTTELAESNPLAKRYQNAKVEFKVQNASLRKIMDYVMAIETLPNMLRVTSLRIKALYQNKLYFDATLEVEGTVQKAAGGL